MTEEQKMKQFAQLINQAALVFADTRVIGKDLLRAYWDVLHSYRIEDISDALDRLYQTRTFRGLPMPAEIKAVVHVTPPEPDRPALLTFAELEGNSARFRFCRYLMLSGEWKNLGDDPEGRKWRGLYEQWESAGQPMPSRISGKSILKGMEA